MPTSRAPCSVATPCSTASGCSTSRSRAATARTTSGPCVPLGPRRWRSYASRLSTSAGERVRTSRIVGERSTTRSVPARRVPRVRDQSTRARAVEGQQAFAPRRRVIARKRGRRSGRRCVTTGASPGRTPPRSSRPGGEARACARIPRTPRSRHLSRPGTRGETRNGRAPRGNPAVRARAKRTQRE